MKKLVFVSLALLVGAGIVIGFRMAKGKSCGFWPWGGEKVDPWSTYAPPPEESPAGAGGEAGASAETAEGASTEGESAEGEAAEGEAADASA